VLIAAKGTAQHAELKLINGMAVLLEDIEAVIDLLDGVKSHLRCTLENILITQVTARHTRLIGTEVAIVLAAKAIRRKRYADIDNAALRTDALVNEDIPEILDVGIVDRVLLEHLAVNHTELALSTLILVLLGSDAQAGIEAICILVVIRIHLDDILED
jgi:hypothetical protein